MSSIIDRIDNINPQIIYIILFILVALPLVRPFGLPVPVTQYTRDVYNLIEELPPGGVVYFSPNYGPAGDPTFGSAARAIAQHIFNRPLRVIFMSYAVNGPLMVDHTLERIDIPPDKEYGVDYVNLGYIAGMETAMASIAADVHNAFPNDVYETPIGEIPMMADIIDGGDIDLIISFSGDGNNFEAHMRQFQTIYGNKIAVVLYGIMLPQLTMYYPHNIMGIINGLKGGAEYEYLINKPGFGLASMDGQSSSHLMILGFMILGNIAYWVKRQQGER